MAIAKVYTWDLVNLDRAATVVMEVRKLCADLGLNIYAHELADAEDNIRGALAKLHDVHELQEKEGA